MSGTHEEALRGIGYINPLRGIPSIHVLSVEEYRSLSCNDQISNLEDVKLEKVFIRPCEAIIQNEYMIDVRNYSASSVPTLTELYDDFKVATSILVDFVGENPEFLLGFQSVSGAGSQKLSFKIPPTAAALMSRYRSHSGREHVR